MHASSSLCRAPVAGLLLVLAGLAGCDAADPLGLEDAPTVVIGRVSSVGSAATTSTAQSPSSSLAGIEVSVEGAAVSDVTDDSGEFRLEVRAEDGRIRIRFRRGSLDVRLELEGVPPGGVVQVAVGLDDGGASLLSRDDDDDDDFDGRAALVGVDGDAPSRVLRVELTGEGATYVVDLMEGSTLFDNEGDILTFEGLLAALERADLHVEIEGDGERRDDGTVIATSIKVETSSTSS